MSQSTKGTDIPPLYPPEDPHGQAYSGREDKGTDIPPRSAMRLRWKGFLADSKSDPTKEALRLFEDALSHAPRDPLPTLGLGLVELNADKPPMQDPEIDDDYSRVFRVAHRLSRAYEIEAIQRSGGDRELHINFLGKSIQRAIPTDLQVKMAVENLVHSISKKTDAELDAQHQDSEMFMLWAAKSAMHAVNQMPWTCLVMDVIVLGLAWPNYEAKRIAKIGRPNRWDTTIDPVLMQPTHSSWPAGHAFTGGALVVLLAQLGPSKNQFTERLVWAATRVGRNRERAGLHTGLDTEAGFVLGCTLMTSLLSHLAQFHGSNPNKFERVLWEALSYAKSEWTS